MSEPPAHYSPDQIAMWRQARRFTVQGAEPLVPFFVDTSQSQQLLGLVRVNNIGDKISERPVSGIRGIFTLTTSEVLLTPEEALAMARELVRVASLAAENCARFEQAQKENEE